MGLTVTNLIAGPADLYVASFGAVEPTDAAINTVPASAVWTDVGGTNDGVKASIDQNYMKLEADQSVDVLGSRLTGREVIVETAIAEPTLANLVILLNGGTITASAAFQTYDPVNGDTAASQPTYRALLFDGWAPGATPLRRRVIVRKILSVEGAKDMAYKKDGQMFVPAKFLAHYVSASTRLFRIIDQLT